jgi:hypothetical protein
MAWNEDSVKNFHAAGAYSKSTALEKTAPRYPEIVFYIERQPLFF